MKEFKQNDDKRQETSYNNTSDNFNRDIMQTEPCNKNSNISILKSANNSSKLSALDIQLDLIINKSVDKKNENLNDKLNLYKNALDDVIKLASTEMSKVLGKIHGGYIEVIQKMIEKLNSKTSELDILTTSIIKIITRI